VKRQPSFYLTCFNSTFDSAHRVSGYLHVRPARLSSPLSFPPPPIYIAFVGGDSRRDPVRPGVQRDADRLFSRARTLRSLALCRGNDPITHWPSVGSQTANSRVFCGCVIFTSGTDGGSLYEAGLPISQQQASWNAHATVGALPTMSALESGLDPPY